MSSKMCIAQKVESSVKNAVKNVVGDNNEPITAEQLTEILTNAITSVMSSSELIDYVDDEFARKVNRRT